MSIEAILMNGTSSPASRSASDGANALEQKATPRSRAWSLATTCCSGVSWYARTISRSDPKCFFVSE